MIRLGLVGFPNPQGTLKIISILFYEISFWNFIFFVLMYFILLTLFEIWLLQVCNKHFGYRSLGYQTDPNIDRCDDPELERVEFGSKNVRRSVVSTFGTFPSTNQSEWMKSVAELHRTVALRQGFSNIFNYFL